MMSSFFKKFKLNEIVKMQIQIKWNGKNAVIKGCDQRGKIKFC